MGQGFEVRYCSNCSEVADVRSWELFKVVDNMYNPKQYIRCPLCYYSHPADSEELEVYKVEENGHKETREANPSTKNQATV
jgi:hypothetical protein